VDEEESFQQTRTQQRKKDVFCAEIGQVSEELTGKDLERSIRTVLERQSSMRTSGAPGEIRTEYLIKTDLERFS
jgi:hypothetical protein